MNTSNIKKYAPLARKQFRDAVVQKLTTLGISADKKGGLAITDATDLGDSVRFGQFTLPKSLVSRRERLVKRAEKQGYEVLVEHIAYTWFNRLCAIRYMELQGYLEHGFRLLSHPQVANGFEVLDHVPEVAENLGLDKARLVEMKLAGNQEEGLYRELLLGQCHALHTGMPFLFDAVNDEIELVLPDNLIRTDSILRGLVDSIPEEDWEQVEIIGWMYQFYISEKKDEVIGKVVKSEDIPAATQLFTPNWIVQYLVQNSVGRQWLQTYPASPLKGKMPYYIEPAEQTQEVQAQLAAITPASIEPESIKVLDPACGSGHILTEAYNVLKAIYEERGYRNRDIPQLILENNLFGLDIDDRAAQLSAFALLMLARQDDRRILNRGGIRLNIVSLQESLKLDVAALWNKLNFHQQSQTGSVGDMFSESTTLANTYSAEYQLLMRTLQLFVKAKTFGSLIQVPQEDEAALKILLDALYRLEEEGDIAQKEAVAELMPFIQQAWILAQRYDAVVANPPYMGSKGMNGELKEFAKREFPESKSDLFAMFISKGFCHLKPFGNNAMVTMQSWMFLSFFVKLRNEIIEGKNINNFVHIGYNSFPELNSKIAQACAFSISNGVVENYKSDFIGLNFSEPSADKNKLFLNERHSLRYSISQKSIKCIPGNPIAFWIGEEERTAFEKNISNGDVCQTSNGIQTGNNEKYVREWWEVNNSEINDKWMLYNKGGQYRKWYGNVTSVINWEDDARDIRHEKNSGIGPEDLLFKECITWTDVTWRVSARFLPEGYLSDHAGPCAYFNEKDKLYTALAIFNTPLGEGWSKLLNPTLHFQAGDFKKLPFPGKDIDPDLVSLVKEIVAITKKDWDSNEISNQFKWAKSDSVCLRSAFNYIVNNNKEIINHSIDIERKIQEKILNIFSINNNVIDINIDLISLDINPCYKYSSGTTEERNLRFQSEFQFEQLNFIIGCQMGRYSLDREGLVYAHEGNKGFAELVAEGAYNTFPADSDGILPLLDNDWFDDDVTTCVKEFVCTVWGEEHLQENLDFIAESLCLYAIKPKKGESSLDTIRRYLSTQFWKDHMKMYKKRPIYWLFSSGKEKAFECLVYLHRYNEATLSRMRTEYVVPLLARYQGNIDQINDEIRTAESGAATTRLKKELDNLTKKFDELRRFDDRLRHHADRRITIDLDDGVKVNYGKFGDLLADVKAITGNAPEEA